MMRQDNTRRSVVVALAATLALGLVAVPAAAHEGTNHGTIKVHDNATANPPQRNEPHVDCEFWVEGFNMAGDSGSIVIRGWPPTDHDREVVLTANWTGTPDNGGFRFLVGPLNISTDGHYRVEAFLDQGHPGAGEHFAKSKMFWVDCVGEQPECPVIDLQLEALPDGDVLVSFTPLEGSNGTNIYRAEGSGELEYIATVDAPGDEYIDSDTEVGVTYTYAVTALFGSSESEICEEAEITTIPVFPTMVGLVAASVAGLGAYVALRRRSG